MDWLNQNWVYLLLLGVVFMVSRGRMRCGIGGMSVGLSLLPYAGTPWMVAVAVALSAAGIGILIPALAVRISVAAGARQGRALGRQTAAANVGQATAAAVTGVLYAAAAPAPFLLATAVLAIGAWRARRAD